MNAVDGNMIGKEIADMFGIKHCKHLQIDLAKNQAVTIIAEFYPEIDGVKQCLAILKRYELVEKE